MSGVPGSLNPPATTAAESTAVEHLPWTTEPVHLGIQGVVLSKSVDALNPQTELARLTNAIPRASGGLQTRPGLTVLFSGLTSAHSFARLNDPQANSYTRFVGDSTLLRRGQSGVPAVIDTGFSGTPLSFVPWQSENTGESWMYVADANKMRKATRTGVSLPIGLPKPTVPTVAANVRISVTTATFAAGDGTAAGSWTPFAGVGNGFAFPRPPGYTGAVGVPTLANVAAPGSGSGVELTYVVGTSNGGFSAGMAITKAIDLSSLSDEDDFHLWMKISDFNDSVEEVRIYFVCSAFTLPSAGTWAIPGMGRPYNVSAYMRSFKPSDYQRALMVLEDVENAAERVRTAQFLEGYANPPITEKFPHANKTPTLGVPTSPAEWAEMGIPGFPIRRGEFTKIGAAGTTGVDWSTITGIIILVTTKAALSAKVAFADSFMTGGYKPDTSEPDAFSYDYRITNVDKRTGAESNPSDDYTTFDGATKNGGIDVMRQSITVTPPAYGDVNVFQRAYRRGGSLNDNWYGPVADNSVGGDGTAITDNAADITAESAGTLETDHDQPVTTATTLGAAVYAQPVPVLFGPLDGFLFALGDPYRPGDVYWSKRNEPDHWPASNHREVCPPSEKLMNGGLYGGQLFAFSLERLYGLQVNLLDGTVTSSPTDCAHGLAGRWAMDVGPLGIAFVARDGVYLTTGGAAKYLSGAIRPLFHGETVNGYNPIDFSQANFMQLRFHGDELWFGCSDSTGCNVWWIYSFTYDHWRCSTFNVKLHGIYSEPQESLGLSLLLGGFDSGKAYLQNGYTDDGSPILCNARTASTDFGRGREEKLLGDVIVWANTLGGTLTAQTFLNGEVTAGPIQSVSGGSAYARYVFGAFGTAPQHAQTCAVDLSWSGQSSGSPLVQRAGVSMAVQPEITLKRATTWAPLNENGESYLQGCWIDCDTFGSDKVVLVEGLLSGTTSTIATLTINCSGGRRKWFSWSAAHVDLVRIRPTTDVTWELFGIGWLSRPEPPRQITIDSGLENLGDTYYTGLDIEIDTFNQNKTIVVQVDGAAVGTPFTIAANGRRLIHLTLPWGRGHIYQFYSTDSNPALLYSHKWLVDAEPGEQANWNENFTIAGTRADKLLKGFTVECDTFGQNKTVTVEVDGSVVETVTVNTNGRKVVHVSFPQHLGRVFRMFPTDSNPSRRYSFGWIFDQEPFQLTRFETQEQRHALDEWHFVTYGQITYKASDVVTLTVYCYGQGGNVLATDVYTLASTSGVKGMTPFKPQSRKGVLFKYVLTCSAGFWLYREESWVETRGWNTSSVAKQHPFGNDDLDPTRGMTDATGAATAAGGMAV